MREDGIDPDAPLPRPVVHAIVHGLPARANGLDEEPSGWSYGAAEDLGVESNFHTPASDRRAPAAKLP